MPTTETKETIVSRANDPLVGTVITTSDVTRNIAIIGDVGNNAKKCFCLLITFKKSGKNFLNNNCFLRSKCFELG